jgi:hypothetical protein
MKASNFVLPFLFSFARFIVLWILYVFFMWLRQVHHHGNAMVVFDESRVAPLFTAQTARRRPRPRPQLWAPPLPPPPPKLTLRKPRTAGYPHDVKANWSGVKVAKEQGWRGKGVFAPTIDAETHLRKQMRVLKRKRLKWRMDRCRKSKGLLLSL